MSRKNKEFIVTPEDMESWIGRDTNNQFPYKFVMETLCELANGDYAQETFRDDVLDIRGNDE